MYHYAVYNLNKISISRQGFLFFVPDIQGLLEWLLTEKDLALHAFLTLFQSN